MGKSNSKLKKKDRSQSITWSFRFPSLLSLSSRRKMPASGPHLDIGQWLTILELSQYVQLFDNYTGVEELLSFSEADIKDLGVKNAAHRARIVSSLVALRAKYNKGARKAEKAAQRHSMAVDPSRYNTTPTESDILAVSNVTQSKSLCNIRMEAQVDSGAELKKALEWELSLDTRDLRSHAWYHGAIPRTRAEEIVRDPGMFLVRDCTSQPGNFVLTCRTPPAPLHFVIKKLVIQPDTVYERVQYQFEDEPFDTVPDLITYYVGNGKPVTTASKARISTPCNRMYPLSFYATKYGQGSQRASPLASPLSNSSGTLRPASQNSVHSPAQSPPRSRRELPPKLPGKKQRNHSETNGRAQRQDDQSNSADGVIMVGGNMTRSVEGCFFTSHSLPRRPKSPHSAGLTTVPRNFKSCSLQEEGPPPKPSMRPVLLKLTELDYPQRVYHGSGSDSGNGSGDSAQSSAAGDPLEPPPPHRPGGVVIKNPRYFLPPSSSSTTLKAFDYELEDPSPPPVIEIGSVASSFDLDNFQTLLLPVTENKPLDSSALEGVRMRLHDTGSRIIANHLTRMDLELTISESRCCNWSEDITIPVNSAIELCTLPIGHRMRLDLIERTVCLKLLVAVTILTCQVDAERAETLNKWIQVAIDTKTALGNLFGFNAIMLGLCMPQIQRLSVTWHIMRQKFTDSAFNFEAKLKPTLKNMNECTNPQAPNTTIPHLLPFMLLQERDLEQMLDEGAIPQSIESNCLLEWEKKSSDFGLTTLFAHLDTARKFSTSIPTYRRNAEIVLGDSKVDDILLDMFRTEFHLKFLWGSRGANHLAHERYSKFEQVLSVMSNNCEPVIETPPPSQSRPAPYNPAIGTSV